MEALPTLNELQESLQLLNQQEREEVDRLLLSKPIPLWQPNPANRPQCLAFESTADVIGYGGAAGSGKSDLAIGMAAEKHYHSVIFRRVFPSLRGLIERTKHVLDNPESATRGRFNESNHIWRLPGGRIIELGAIQYDDDKKKHQGQPRDFFVFDEAAEFPEAIIRYLLAWNRTTRQGVQAQALLTFNPPSNTEGQWIIKFFGPWLDRNHSRPAVPGELRYFYSVDGKELAAGGPGEITTPNGERVKPRSRTFFPARVTDNPYWEGTDYIAQLQALPEPLRSQLLYGDMTAGMDDDAYQAIPSAWIRAAMARWEPKVAPGALSCLGVDVARGGKDSTALAARHGTWFAEIELYPGSTTKDGQAVVGLMIPRLEHGGVANVDVIGVGSSAVDIATMQGLAVTPVNFGEGTEERDAAGILGFQNVRALAYWRMREALDPTRPVEDQIALPNDEELFHELAAHRYEPGLRGIKIKSKDEVKEIIGRSPDRADAVVLANLLIGYNLDEDALMEFYKGKR